MDEGRVVLSQMNILGAEMRGSQERKRKRQKVEVVTLDKERAAVG